MFVLLTHISDYFLQNLKVEIQPKMYVRKEMFSAMQTCNNEKLERP